MDKPRVVFLSTPMRGKSDEQIINRLNVMIKGLRNKFGDEILFKENFSNTAGHTDGETDPPYDPDNPLLYLGRAIQRLGECDAILMDAGWEDARGCRIERQVALEYGIQVYFLTNYGDIV